MNSQPSSLFKQTAEAINQFQFDCYNQFSEPKNLVISPLGLYFVLAMLHEGARGKTREILSHLLQQDDSDLSLASGIKMLVNELHSRTELTPHEKELFKEKEAYIKELIDNGD